MEEKRTIGILHLVLLKLVVLNLCSKVKANAITTWACCGVVRINTAHLIFKRLAIDTEKPVIKPYNFQDGKWLSKYRYLKLKISDKHSGIKNYRATVNGKWILMEYDYKKGTLVHDFNDKAITDTKNILKIIVTDNVGNSSTFETTFYRK